MIDVAGLISRSVKLAPKRGCFTLLPSLEIFSGWIWQRAESKFSKSHCDGIGVVRKCLPDGLPKPSIQFAFFQHLLLARSEEARSQNAKPFPRLSTHMQSQRGKKSFNAACLTFVFLWDIEKLSKVTFFASEGWDWHPAAIAKDSVSF